MLRRTLLSVVALGLSGLAFGQEQKAAMRPEALLPEQTFLYIGTDDLEAMKAKGRASPIGRILAEQEMKDFLEKPIAQLRQTIEKGLSEAKQHPALAQVDVNVDKLMAGPYGRAFFAVTHVQLPPPDAFDPTKIDAGVVIGIEPRPGSPDPLALILQVIRAFAGMEGGPPVTIETVQGEDVSYECVRAPAPAPALCFANVGGLSLLTVSERALADIAKRAKSGGASLMNSPGFVRGASVAGASAAGDLVVFMHLGRMFDLVHQAIALAMTMNGEAEGRAIVDKVFEITKFSALGPLYANSGWRDGVAVETAYVEIDPSAGGISALVRPRPIDRDAIRFVPKNALGFSLGSIELAPLWDMVMDGLKAVVPEVHEEVTTQLRAFETKVAGADDQGNPKWNVRRDLISALSGRMMTVSTPSSAAGMFGGGGDFTLSLETPNPQGLETSLKHLFALTGELAGNPIVFKEQAYGNAKLNVLDPMSIPQVGAMFASSFSITYAIHGDRFWFSTTTKSLKKMFDRVYGPPADAAPANPEGGAVAPLENITANPNFASRYVEPPKGAVITGLSYSDTAKNFENTYSGLIQGLTMAMTFAGGLDDLPIDVSLLPTGDTIAKHLFGTVTTSYRVGESGHVTVSRGPLGPEVAGVAVIGAAMVASIGADYAQKRAASEVPAPVQTRPKSDDPSEQVLSDFRELSSAITIYMIEYTKPPATLDDLVKATPEYPTGLIEGSVLPVDPWGHAYAYKTDGGEQFTIWSFGPNGVDDGGAGDDIKHGN